MYLDKEKCEVKEKMADLKDHYVCFCIDLGLISIETKKVNILRTDTTRKRHSKTIRQILAWSKGKNPNKTPIRNQFKNLLGQLQVEKEVENIH